MPCFRRPLEVEMSFLGLLTSPFSQSQQTPPPLQRNADTLSNPPTSPPSPVVSMQDEFPIKTEATETIPSYFICLRVVCWKRFSFSVLKRLLVADRQSTFIVNAFQYFCSIPLSAERFKLAALLFFSNYGCFFFFFCQCRLKWVRNLLNDLMPDVRRRRCLKNYYFVSPTATKIKL